MGSAGCPPYSRSKRSTRVGLPSPTLPEPEALRRDDGFALADLAVILGVLALLGVIAHVGSQAMVSFRPPEVSPTVSLDPRDRKSVV